MFDSTDDRWNWKPPALIATGVFLLIAISAMAFRSPAKGTIAGRVLCQGKPVVVGTIVVLAGDGKLRAVPIDADGSYQVAGVPRGKVQLGVISRDPARIQERFSKLAPTDRLATEDRISPQVLDKRKWFPVPKQYEDPHYSGLETTIAAQARFDIELR